MEGIAAQQVFCNQRQGQRLSFKQQWKVQITLTGKKKCRYRFGSSEVEFLVLCFTFTTTLFFELDVTNKQRRLHAQQIFNHNLKHILFFHFLIYLTRIEIIMQKMNMLFYPVRLGSIRFYVSSSAKMHFMDLVVALTLQQGFENNFPQQSELKCSVLLVC